MSISAENCEPRSRMHPNYLKFLLSINEVVHRNWKQKGL